MFRKLATRKLEEEVYWYSDHSEWATNMKMFVSHVNVYQRLPSAEEDFNNQMDRMTLCVDTVPLSPATAVIAQRTHDLWPW